MGRAGPQIASGEPGLVAAGGGRPDVAAICACEAAVDGVGVVRWG
jgi:hypothetical protein